MIDLHYWPTPNGKKLTIQLEESGIDYRVVYCADNKKAGQQPAEIVHLYTIEAKSRQLNDQNTQSSCLRYRLRPAVDIEFAMNIASVNFDCVQRNE